MQIRLPKRRFTFLLLITMLFVGWMTASGTLIHSSVARGQTIPPGTIPPSALIYINEIMADNETTLADGDGDYPDWIELFNAGDTTVNLAGWSITDKPHVLTRWVFPAVSVPPGGYLVLFASGKDRRDPAYELHTNFSLSAGGEFLALLDPDGIMVAAYSPAYPPQYPDMAYGLDMAGNERYLPIPTPGSDNNVAGNLGPLISRVAHSPEQPLPNEALEVTAVLQTASSEPTDEITGVELIYRINFQAEQRLAMAETPTPTGATRTFRAIIPAAAYSQGDIVRYAVLATDATGREARYPLFVEPSASPQYQGTLVIDASVESSLPVFHWFIQNPNGVEEANVTPAVVFYDGVLYDNVHVRLRGDTSAAAGAKKSYKFFFNDGYHLRLTPDGYAVDEINVNTNAADASYLRQALAWEAFRDAGAPYSMAFLARVQRNGSFFGLYTLVESLEEPYFERQDLDPAGALYKMHENNLNNSTEGIEKKTREEEDNRDLIDLIAGIHRNGDRRTTYLYDNINIPAAINYLAVSAAIHHWDMVIKNYHVYRDTEDTGEWTFLPWDMDLTFYAPSADGLNAHPLHGTQAYPLYYIPGGFGYWNHLIDALLTTPDIQAMYLRRLRSVMDQLLQEPDAPYEQRYFETRINALLIQAEADAQLDFNRWHPSTSFADAVRELKDDISAQRTHLYLTYGPAEGIIPEAQPSDARVLFGAIELAAAGADLSSEYFVLTNPNQYAVDISGWRVAGDVEYRFQPGVVIPARGALYVAKDVTAFRNRPLAPTGGMGLLVQGGYAGNMTGRIGNLRLLNKNDELVDRVTYGYPLPTNIFLPVVRTE